MSDFLPKDLLIDVLTGLPIKTLGRCACVCKSWYSLITNPNFITTQVNRSSANSHNHLTLIRTGNGKSMFYRVHRSRHSDTKRLYRELEGPLKSCRDLNLRIIGSSNGLLCLSEDLHSYKEKLILWNLSIKKTMELPPLRVTSRSHGRYMHSIGFGFDSVTDDYKVVRIAYLEGTPDPPEVDIFSLSTGTWRDITHLGLSHNIHERSPQVYLNGASHWLAYDRKSPNTVFHLIVSFHMGDEVFREIMVPDIIFSEYAEGSVNVVKFQDSLSLIAGILGDKPCCLWVMKEYGIRKSWTKMFNIRMLRGVVNSVCGFTREGYIIHIGPYEEVILRRDSIYTDDYTESLVLLGAKFRDTVTCEDAGKKSRKRNERRGYSRIEFYFKSYKLYMPEFCYQPT